MAALPRVWLLGDSIRMSYQPLVAEALAGKAEVVGPGENGQFALHTLANLGVWYEQLGKPDIVHWNNGIHDSGHNPLRRPVQIPLDVYVMTLRLILQNLRRWTDRTIWATSTPPHPDRPFVTDTWSWRPDEFEAYHAAAMELMRSESLPINDLHDLVAADIQTNLSDDQLHLSETGNQRCADTVAKAIEKVL